MKSVMVDVYRLLKPGGHFVFSVPHPLLLFLESQNDNSDSTFAFPSNDNVKGSYFSIRDYLFSGTIKTLDNVHNRDFPCYISSVFMLSRLFVPVPVYFSVCLFVSFLFFCENKGVRLAR